MKITDTEWSVMRVVWDRSSVGAAAVIAALIPETGWSHRTVRTLLNRLAEKGALTVELRDGRNIYRAKVHQSKCIRQESQNFLKKVFDGDAAEMLTHFVKTEKITAAEIRELQKLLDAKRKEEK